MRWVVFILYEEILVVVPDIMVVPFFDYPLVARRCRRCLASRVCPVRAYLVMRC